MVINICISVIWGGVLHCGEGQKVVRAVKLVVEFLRDGRFDLVFHSSRVHDAHKVIVPYIIRRYHE